MFIDIRNILYARSDASEDTPTDECKELPRTFDELIATWRRIGTDTAATEARSTSVIDHERAMLACAAKAVVEEEARKAKPNERQEVDQDGLARLRRENANMQPAEGAAGAHQAR